MNRLDTLADWLIANRRVVIVVGLLVTAALGSGVPSVVLETSHDEFVGGTASSETNEYVESNFRAGPENATAAYVIVRREYHVVGYRDIKEQLRFQRRLMQDERVAPTLANDHPPLGISNVVSFVAIQKREGRAVDPLPEPRPPLQKQLRTIQDPALRDTSSGTTPLERYEDDAVAALNEDPTGPTGGVYAFVPKYYDNRYNRRAHGTVIYVYQRDDLTDRERLRSQVAMREIADEVFRETPGTDQRVYGTGIVDDELDRSTTDSLQLVGPLALLLVLAVLLYAYRDPLDVLLALAGVGLVLVWTFGFMGWAGIEFNQLFVSIPVFLTGLAIDYAIHAVMRYREERDADHFDPRVVFLGEDGDPGVRRAMVGAVAGVGGAFVLVTLTTAAGFASNVASPLQPVREFGIVAAVGIVSTLIVFGALLPAVKVELDEWLEARSQDRQRQPFATGEGPLNAVLAQCVRLAERTPWAVVGVALLTTSVGLVGATTVDTTFDQSELHVEDTPAWLDNLPEPLKPGNYTTHASLKFFRESGFVNQRNTAHILVQGEVTRPDALERLVNARKAASESNVTLEFGRPDARDLDASSEPIPSGTGPVLVMRAVAAENESFNATFHAADTDGNGIPDKNLRRVYDALFAADREAAETVVHRSDGQYRALRLGLYTDGTEGTQRVAAKMHETAATIDGDGLRASATGQPVVRAAVQNQLFVTILRSFALTLGVVLVLLLVVYRLRRGSATLGLVTMLPVLFALAWILGTMAALGLRFNVLTALVTSFTIGLGVDYSIHVSERYAQELERLGSIEAALRTSVFGTGGALLGSALTTAGGFGVLVFAILDPLKQFGAITAITIVYAFLASVVVLPSLLVLWTQWIGTPTKMPAMDPDRDDRPTATDGGE